MRNTAWKLLLLTGWLVALGACGSTETRASSPGAGERSAPVVELPQPMTPVPDPETERAALRERVVGEASVPEEPASVAEPSPAVAPEPYAAPGWAAAIPAFEGRVVILGTAQRSRVRAARVAAIEQALGELMRRFELETEPPGVIVERASVIPRREGGYTAYVLVTAPEQR